MAPMHAARRLAAQAQTWGSDRWLWLATFGITVLVALLTIHPFRDFAIGSDSASSVLYFERIAAGRRLEAFLGTTPKPLLSVVYGTLYALTHDWRVVGVLATFVYGIGVASTTLLVRRWTGSLAGAVFAAAGLLATWQLFQEASLAYAGVWLLAGCSIAGLLVSERPPRYAAAGVALLVAAIARQEALFLVGLAVLGVALAEVRRRRGGPAVDRRAWLLAIGLLALPLTALHDWLLAGDPTYSLHVQALGAAGRPVPGLDGTVDLVVRHFSPALPLLALALAGVLLVLARRQWAALAALIGLGPAVLGLVLFVGWRNLIVLERYLLPVDVALVVAGAISVGAAGAALRSRLRVRGDAARAAAAAGAAAAAVALGLVLSPRVGPVDQRLLARIALESGGVADLARLRPSLEREIASMPGVRDPKPDPDPETQSLDRVVLIVPPRFLPQLAVELGLGLDRVARVDSGRLGDDGSYPPPGWLVLLQRGLLLPPESAAAFLEVAEPSTAGALRIEPLATIDERAWLLRIDAGP
jgi:hypothetical protein